MWQSIINRWRRLHHHIRLHRRPKPQIDYTIKYLRLAGSKNLVKVHANIGVRDDLFPFVFVDDDQMDIYPIKDFPDRFYKLKQCLFYIGGFYPYGIVTGTLFLFLYFIEMDFFEKYEEYFLGLCFIKSSGANWCYALARVIPTLIKEMFITDPQPTYIFNIIEFKVDGVTFDASVFNDKEIEYLEWQMRRLTSLSENNRGALLSADVPWFTAHDGEVINLQAVLYRTDKTSVRID